MNLPFTRCCWQLAIGSPNNDRGFFCRLCAHQNAAGPAPCETYPSRPITMVLPFAAGGPTDTLARIIACQNASFARVVVLRRTNPEAELDRIDLQHRLDTKEHVRSSGHGLRGGSCELHALIFRSARREGHREGRLSLHGVQRWTAYRCPTQSRRLHARRPCEHAGGARSCGRRLPG